jgi:putative ABC transport system permease protein
MNKTWLLLALRFMQKQKGFSVINITGLTIGISCSLLLAIYVYDELRYDTFHADAEKIYRVTYRSKLQGKELNTALTPAQLPDGLASSVPGITSVVRIAAWKTFPIRFEDKSFTEDYLLLADSNFFNFFSFRLVHGKPGEVLKGERKIVLTTAAAERYFGQSGAEIIGRTLALAQGYMVKVSGIAEVPPSWSHFHFTHILSMDSWRELGESSWLLPRVHTYIKVQPETSDEELSAKLNAHVRSRANDELLKTRSVTYDQFRASGNSLTLELQPLRRIHLHSALADEIEQNGDSRYVLLFMSIAIFIALLACINFINLSTARSAGRAKEVGVRKTVGASTWSLMKQFLVESYFFVVVSFFLSFFVIALVLAPFNYFTGKQLPLSLLISPQAIFSIILLTLSLGFLAGSYPSVYLSQFSPIEVLRGKLREQLRSFGIRNILVVFQFFISSSLIVATLVVYNQLTYVQQMNLGFSKEKIINLLHTKNLEDRAGLFKEELLKSPSITHASYANRLPPNLEWTAPFHPIGVEKEYLMTVYEMDVDHLETMQLSLAQGRFFSRDVPADTLAIIINETALGLLGWTDITDKYLFSGYDTPVGRNRKVIGVLRDFHFRSAREPITALAVIPGPQPGWEMAVRVTGDVDSARTYIESVWNKFLPNTAFEAQLVEQNLSDAYKAEKRIGVVFLVFTMLAIFIACLGLFGLATFTAEQRTKEIGIRKVLGAGVFSIAALLNKSFIRLVLVGNLLAWPVAWWFMSRWLSEFEYHTSIPAWLFLVTLLVTLLIAFLSVSYQAVKAAQSNPVRSLRNE